jgi:hypothetical protein
MLEIFPWILVVIAGLIALDRLFLWMETKGWVYYRKVKSKSSGGFTDVLLGGNVFEPGAQAAMDARQERPGEEDEDDGDDIEDHENKSKSQP